MRNQRIDPAVATIYVGLGSNVGNRIQNLRQAIQMVRPDIVVDRISPVYETSPVGFLDQRDFFNVVFEAHTSLTPEKTLEALTSIEKKLGRVASVRYGPRTIDLDLLFYDDAILHTAELTVPHPRLHERAFVLVPLSDIAPDFLHPVMRKTVRELCDMLQDKNQTVHLAGEQI